MTNVFPASPAQEFMWYAIELEPGRPTYHVPYVIELTGKLDPEALRQSIADIVARHEPLRTNFRYQDGRLWQVVRPHLKIDVPLIDLRHRPDAARSAASIAEHAARELFDLEQDPLLRTRLLRLDGTRHELVLVIHHLVFDGWSTSVLVSELGLAYGARVDGRESALPPLQIQYADVAAWQWAQAAEPAHQAAMEYWRRRLAAAPPALALPASRRGKRSRWDEVEVLRVPDDLAAAVRALARTQRCTMLMTMLAAFTVMLSGATGQHDVIIGVPVADRRRPETTRLIGLLVNMLPVRTNLAGEPTYLDVLAQVKAAVLDGIEHQVPLEHIIADLRPGRRHGAPPLFQVIFWYQQHPSQPYPLGDVEARPRELFNGAAKYQLALGVRDSAGELSCEFKYQADQLDRAAVRRLAEHYLAVLNSIAAEPGRPVHSGTVSDIPVHLAEPDPPQEVVPVVTAHALRAELEDIIAAAWRDILDLDRVGRQDNFFDLGGHSRLMVQVRERLVRSLRRDLALLDLFEYPTISALAAHLADQHDAGRDLELATAGAEHVAAMQLTARLRLRQGRGSTE